MNSYYDQKGSSSVPEQHDVTMKGRKHLDISGVKHVESFDNEEFLLETVMGMLSVRGQNLQRDAIWNFIWLCRPSGRNR